MLVAATTNLPKRHDGRVHTVSVYVSNKPGVLARIALVFARRAYNIESLIVSPAAKGGFSRTTITCTGDPATLEQIIRQLGKLVDVVHATDSTDRPTVETEIALVKIQSTTERRGEILQVAQHFNAKVVDFGADTIVMRVYGVSEKLDGFLAVLEPYGVLELVRTGKIAMVRGSEVT
ncbi:MAG: acetolactate synthase small subunit [Nannocystaceae bacterium]